LIYDIIHKKWAGGIIVMGLCRLFLWLTAASSSGISDIAPQTWIWGIVLTGYIIGISLFARGESKKEETPKQISILLLFGAPLTALAGLVYWNQLDPVRVFLINIVGLLIGWIAYSSVLIIKEQKKGAIGIGVSRLLAGICALDAVAICFYSPILITPVLCCLSVAVLMQKKFAAT
jgi:4-hydroxybenzoate polyprenyltransferase